jgi:phosphoserine aminotransferase
LARIHNFSAGPAVLPESVLREAQQALWDVNESGMGILECSHRSPLFENIIGAARERLRRLLKLSDDQELLFLHGGARTQFFTIPMNILRGGRATYLDTGTWAAQAAAEAARFGAVDLPFSSKSTGWDRVPEDHKWDSPPGTIYLHYTSNNTVAGTQYHHVPRADVPVICDMSSDLLSREVDGSTFGLIYGGAQKNVGPAGVTLVVIHKELLDRCDQNLPTMTRYGTHVAKQSMYNTPCTFAIYMVGQVCKWIDEQGGIAAVDAHNRAKAMRLYDVIDASEFWRGKAQVGSRSLMNVTFTTGDDDLDSMFWKAALEAGLSGLKGHKSVGGLRASVYNAQTDAAVAALSQYMAEFEAKHS